MIKIILLSILIIGYISYCELKNSPLELIHVWKQLEYQFPSKIDENFSIVNGLYVEGAGFPVDVDVDRNKHRVFVTAPRFNAGVPITLGVVSNAMGPKYPKLMAYPSYQWQASHGKNCDGITSVFRVAIDECNRLWVLDTGRINTTQLCPPQLLLFDLQNDFLIRRYRFPVNQLKLGMALLITPIVDVRDPPPHGRCENVKVYIADVTGFGLLVYDFLTNFSWRIEHALMRPNPEFGNHTIAGETFPFLDGIFGMSVTPSHHKYSNRKLYFHPFASSNENFIRLSHIDDPALWLNGKRNSNLFQVVGHRNGQTVAEAMDSHGNLYFGLYDPLAVVKWHIETPYKPSSFKIVAKNSKTLQFVSGIKVIRNKLGQEELWLVSSRFQKIMAGTLNPNEENFRVQRIRLGNRPQIIHGKDSFKVSKNVEVRTKS